MTFNDLYAPPQIKHLATIAAGLFAGQMPFLSANQQHQSTGHTANTPKTTDKLHHTFDCHHT